MTTKPIAACRADYPHFHAIATRWMDNDVYGHVNNVVYYSWFDTAVNHFLMTRQAVDIPHGDVIGLVVETHCNYFAPVSFPEAVQVGVRVAAIGNSSVRYELGIFREDDATAAAQGHFIHVYVDAAERRPVKVTDAMRAVLQSIVQK